MSWPAVIRQFARASADASEVGFLGAYNALLCTLFHSNADFMVVPCRPTLSSSSPAKVTFVYEVVYGLDLGKPVLVLQPNALGNLRDRSTREALDRQIRARMTKLSVNCPMPVLYGISAVGSRFAFYTKPRDEAILPQQIPADPGMTTDTAPLERWNCDILEREGEKQLRRVAKEIKAEVRNEV
ncbi:hypothetical protein F5887DRAFT_356328 [Amanita rubescens]|nr:hypothetical protein F5887DRAFT_1081495 [Amanita rubescens]KAF8342386.1 hypothetical protein F5887DRAFT_356328 [Amanita rubescens]